eukprot:COSAG02_NODE_78_length_40609_cov_19.893730_3_plen_44_part_00
MEYPQRSCGDVVGTIVKTKEILGIVVAVNVNRPNKGKASSVIG